MLLRVASRRCAAAAARRRPLSVAAAGDDGALMDALRRCDDIYRRDVAPVNEALHGPLEHAYQPTVLPFVLLLGNLFKEIATLMASGQIAPGFLLKAIGLLIPYVLVYSMPMGMLTASDVRKYLLMLTASY